MAIGKWYPFNQPVSVTQDNPLPPPPPIHSADAKQFGLENFGNTCYVNSVLQALYFCGPFRDLVIQHTDPYTPLRQAFASQPSNAANSTSTSISASAHRKHERKPTVDGASLNGVPNPPTPPVPSSPHTLFSALRSLYIHISQNPAEKGTVAPRAFIEKLRELNEAFRNTMHHDAHEFLNYLLNRIVEEIQEKKHQPASAEDLSRSVNSSSDASHPQSMVAGSSSSASQAPGSTFVHQIFEGVLTSETRCLTCENVSSRDESFLDLSIDIEQNSSVTACLRQFSASEMLCQKNKFFCDACCDLQEAEKRMKIKQLPNVLALHLKRFKYQEDVQRYIKLTYRVAFPFELRLFNTVDDVSNPDRLYQLFAIVVHIGNGPNHGHYISIIKTIDSWLVFDDETVDMIKESDIPKYFGESNSGSAYVLYYQAADLDPGALGLSPLSTEPVVVNHQEPLQYHVADSPGSTSHTLPSLPPGLDCEPRSPVVPSVSPQPPVSTITPQDLPPSSTPKSPRKSPSQLLRISLGSPTSPTRASTIGPGATAEPLSPKRSGLLRPSRPIVQSKVTEEKPNSLSNLITTPLAFPKEDPVSRDPPLPNVGGKEKEENRIQSWFRRKSLRSSGKPRPNSEAAAERPPLPTNVLTVPAVLPSSKDLRSPPEPLVMNITSRFNHVRPTTASGKIPSSSHKEALPPLSINHSVAPTTSSSHLSERYSRALPPIPGSPQGSKITQGPPSSYSRGSSDLVYPQRRHYKDIESSVLPKVPARPATSSGPIGADASPSRFMNGSGSSHLMPVTNGRIIHEMNGDASMSMGLSSPRTGKSGTNKRPKSAHGFSVPSLASASNVASTAGTSIRRATRKLSLTAPMLGFGKKDRSKDKEREGDHEQSPMSLNDYPPLSPTALGIAI
ncbi:hypothetical protein J3A83DRAFT_4525498 [Scleroderma citrinum]